MLDIKEWAYVAQISDWTEGCDPNRKNYDSTVYQ